MKKCFTLLLGMLAVTFASCSSKEQPAKYAYTVEVKEQLASTLARSWKDVKFDCTNLYTYNTSAEASAKTDKALAFIVQVAQHQINLKSGCDKMVRRVEISGGKAAASEIYFLSSKNNSILEMMKAHNITKMYDSVVPAADYKILETSADYIKLGMANKVATTSSIYNLLQEKSDNGSLKLQVNVSAVSAEVFAAK